MLSCHSNMAVRAKSAETLRKIEVARELRANGKSYREAADALGCTYQYVHILLMDDVKTERFSRIKEKACPYVNLRNWMNENRVSRYQLMGLIGMSAHQTFRGYLKGSGAIKKAYIDRILQATGMTYEECFARDDEGI